MSLFLDDLAHACRGLRQQRGRLRSGLVVLELSISVVLLAGARLFIQASSASG